eukprot:11170312-Lingulodinium_polyedra.AAC.1
MVSRVIQAAQAGRQLLDGMFGDAGHAVCSKVQAEELASFLQAAILTGQEGVVVAREVSSTNWARPSDLECVLSSTFKAKSQ